MNSLTALDEILTHLSREGSGGRGVLRFPGDEIPLSLKSYADILGIRKRASGEFELVGESSYDATYMARAVLEVLADYDSKILKFPMEDQLGFFQVARDWAPSVFLPYAKYVVAWPMARYLRNELPSMPEGFRWNPFLFNGKMKRFLKNRLISTSNRNLGLWAGWLQGIKRGCAVLSDENVHKQMLKHKATLSRERIMDPPKTRKLGLTYERFWRSFQEPKPRLYEASPSACWESKRSTGGSRGYIRSILERDELLAMVQVSPYEIREIRGVPLPSFGDALRQAQTTPAKAMVSAVLEPLKVRLITKMNGWRSYTARFYQKAMWRYLNQHEVFRLTGEPLSEGALDSMYKRTDHLLSLVEARQKRKVSFDKFVSGDYSAATDNLDINQTRACFEVSLSHCPTYSEDLREVLRSVLYEQEIHYPAPMVKRGGLEPFEQVTGQLMGSVLSFPILCVINLCCYWSALEEYLDMTVQLSELPVLVNGDDILFAANDDFYAVWKQWIHAVGFELSLGKNYIHPKILTVNSEFYVFNSQTKAFRRQGYLNVGLLFGQSKVGSRERGKNARPIWDQYNDTIPEALDPARANRRFIHYRKKEIDAVTQKGLYNLYLPFERGGLDFVPYTAYHITSFQRRLATEIERRYRQSVQKGACPRGLALGIVRESTCPSTTIPYKHNANLGLFPTGEELPADVVAFEPRLYTAPALSADRDFEEPQMKIRFPKKIVELISNNKSDRMSSEKIVSWPWLLCEIPSTV